MSWFRQSLDQRDHGVRGYPVPVGTEPRDPSRCDLRNIGMVVVSLALMNIGDVKLDDRSGKHLEGVKNGNRCEAKGGGIDDDAGAFINRLVYPFDQLGLAVRLSKF